MEDKEEINERLLQNESVAQNSSSEHLVTKRNRFVEYIKSSINDHIGIFYGSLGALTTATSSVLTKKLSSTQTAGQVLSARYFIQLIFILLTIIGLRKSITIVRNELPYVIARGATPIFANILAYWAYIYIPYDCTSVITFGLIAIFSSVLARIFLKEIQTYYQYFAMMVVLSGVFICAQPGILFNFYDSASSRYDFIKGVSCTFFSGFLFACGVCANRKITQTDMVITVFLMSVFGILIGSFYMLVTMKFWSSLMPVNDIIIIVILGAVSTIGNFFWIRGLEGSNVAEFTMALQLETVFGVILEYILLRAFPYLSVIIGSLFVVFGVILKITKNRVMRFINLFLKYLKITNNFES